MIRKFSINLGPPKAPEIPDIDEMTAQEIPVHAMEVLDADTLERRAQSELVEAREKAIRKLKEPLELAELYRQLNASSIDDDSPRPKTTPAECPEFPKGGKQPLDLADPRILNEEELRAEFLRLKKLLLEKEILPDEMKRLETVRDRLAELETQKAELRKFSLKV